MSLKEWIKLRIASYKRLIKFINPPIDEWTRTVIGGHGTAWSIVIGGFVAWVVGVILLIYGYNSVKELKFGIWMSIIYTAVYFRIVYKTCKEGLEEIIKSYNDDDDDETEFIFKQEPNDKPKADEPKKETPVSSQNDKS